MKKHVITSLALGSAVAFTSLSASAASVENPFSMVKLSSGYQVAEAEAKMMDGKCGADKAGESGTKKMDGKCGEGKHGDDKAASESMKKKDGKCGEGKCGGKKE